MRDIRFKTSTPKGDRVYHVTADDVSVVLDRLPLEFTARLRTIHFNDQARANRTLGYVTPARSEITLCALPPRLSFTMFLVRGQSAVDFGAIRGTQWPPLAIRRFLLYDVLLHELGHLQIIHPDKSGRRKFAREPRAQEFAMFWCKRLWATPFAHPDPVHNKPSAQELLDPDPYLSELLRQIERRPTQCELRLELAKLYRQREMQAEAKQAFESAIAVDPDNAVLHACLGAWHYHHGDFPAAIACYRRATLLDPEYRVAHWCLGESYEGDGNLQFAHLHFQRAADVDPSDKKCREKLTSFLRRHPGLRSDGGASVGTA